MLNLEWSKPILEGSLTDTKKIVVTNPAIPIIQNDVLQSDVKAAKPFPNTIPINEEIEKKENPFERSSSDTISAINENELGINAPYPIPIIIAKMKNIK